ncbi:MAG: helix-turn-helix transcriptional regulator [Synergistaceae bacterium]|nr:helix-turn-helix transcriptional regulator [Synergistaceae bacterium]
MTVKTSDNWLEVHQSKELSEKIRIRRKSFNWSQEELGFRASISRQTISRIERNIFKPSFDTLIDLERVLMMPSGYLCGSTQFEASKNNGRISNNSRLSRQESFIDALRELLPSLSDDQFEDFIEDEFDLLKKKVARNKSRNINVNT